MNIKKELFVFTFEDEKVFYANLEIMDFLQINRKEDLLLSLKEGLSPNDYNNLLKNNLDTFRPKKISFKINNERPEIFLGMVINLEELCPDYKGRMVILIKDFFRDDYENKNNNNSSLIEKNIKHIKDDFVGNVSHELRTPLHGILSYAQFGLKDLEDHIEHYRTHKFLENIYDSGLRMLKLVDDLLDLSKLEANKLNYVIEEDNLKKVLDIVLLEFFPRLEIKGIKFKIVDEHAPGKAYFDRSRIIQVLRNLIQNSIKFSPENSNLTFSIVQDVLKRGDLSLPAVKFIIEDEGIGIDPNDYDKVFEKFAQGRRTMKGAGGSGLGLSISKRIIEDHGGIIYIIPSNNTENVKGCKIAFVLPIEMTF